jgi:CheY-like chemotaxis protein
MRANPEVLMVEDDPQELESLRAQLAAVGFHVVATRSASRAIAVVRDGGPLSQPVLAVIDWDLRMAPDQSATSADVLCVLAHHSPECLAIVYSANIDAFPVRSAIHRAHPRAWLHDKRDGDRSLMQRISRMLDRTVSDLQVRGGTLVVHLPSGAEYRHREAVRLLLHHPEVVTLHSDTATRAVRRFGAWLQAHGSQLHVVSHGNRRYRLSSRDPDRPGAPEGGATP